LPDKTSSFRRLYRRCSDNAVASVLLSTTSNSLHERVIRLDTQSSVHLITNSDLLMKISTSLSPILVQGITGDKLPVTLQGQIRDIGITSYYGPLMAANILSYFKLQETHCVHHDHVILPRPRGGSNPRPSHKSDGALTSRPRRHWCMSRRKTCV
jgi:hypothetical protein